ncbi:2Fe-2S iron-sulfur cluster binding domain-containing protein [Paenibacillus sp. LMG 31456]|uniref:2Fe-2S iron-sulfur cluster binding domain-containing protein n=1 Tax=Paenibacillus foliorum TaxID=2654974 RepID=A0A972K474_9BACL|nr:2Fe-2S iron-sulfur cluster-binding protein [Paenibacillus foliorum]NOU97765.1 2Fe-2S iron-sulfur cluster binding domain-containing protein [Paenibacillus foliorum]
MPNVKLHHNNGELYEQEVAANSNLVVLAGIKKFPHLKYGCGMGKCTKCMVTVLAGGEALAEPNWKENKMIGDKLNDGCRLACQLYISEDIEIRQE